MSRVALIKLAEDNEPIYHWLELPRRVIHAFLSTNARIRDGDKRTEGERGTRDLALLLYSVVRSIRSYLN